MQTQQWGPRRAYGKGLTFAARDGDERLACTAMVSNTAVSFHTVIITMFTVTGNPHLGTEAPGQTTHDTPRHTKTNPQTRKCQNIKTKHKTYMWGQTLNIGAKRENIGVNGGNMPAAGAAVQRDRVVVGDVSCTVKLSNETGAYPDTSRAYPPVPALVPGRDACHTVD